MWRGEDGGGDDHKCRGKDGGVDDYEHIYNQPNIIPTPAARERASWHEGTGKISEKPDKTGIRPS